MDAGSDAVVVLVVDKWDLEDDGEQVSEEEAGVRRGQRFAFDADDILGFIGEVPPVDTDAYDHAMISLLEGEDVEQIHDHMMDEVSSRTGWCIIASHVELPATERTEES